MLVKKTILWSLTLLALAAWSHAADPLFDDPVLARGQSVLVRQSQVDDMFASFRASRAALGQVIPAPARARIEADILEKLIATQLCLARATDTDRAQGSEIARQFVAEQKKLAPSEASFNRQLLAAGMTPEQFHKQVADQAIVKAVIDRELRAGKTIGEAEARKFYTENSKLFEQPESVRVAHILISTQDAENRDLPAEQKVQKRELAEKILARARSGEDFTQLIKEFSEDKNAKDRNGEYTITRNERRYVLPPEFEGAAFSLPLNQISDLVVSSFGYHIIRSLEKLPPRKLEFEKAQDRIKETLIQETVQKELPSFIDRLKREAGVQTFLTGAANP